LHPAGSFTIVIGRLLVLPGVGERSLAATIFALSQTLKPLAVLCSKALFTLSN
jgi:hypothetical protein